MKYLSYALENYRGIKEKITIEINDSKSLSCIIGNNESGKTTILQGIKIIGQLCKGHVFVLDKINSFRPRLSSFTGDIIFSTKIELNEDEISIFRKKTNLFSKLSQNLELEISFIYKFNNNEYKNTTQEIKNFNNNDKTAVLELVKEKSPEIIYYEDFKFTVPEKIRFLREKEEKENTKTPTSEDMNKRENLYQNLLKDERLTSTTNKFWQDIFDNLVMGAIYPDSTKQYTFQDEIVNKIDDDTTFQQRIEDINQYLNRIITQDWQDITGGKAKFNSFYIQQVRSKNDGKPFDDYFDDYKLSAKTTQVFSIPERSKGCQWYFCFKIYTEIKSKGKNNNGIIFLLDEPASNLHIYPQEKILQCLLKLSSEEQTSVIYSTHSPFLIDEKSNNYIAENNDDSYEENKIKCFKADSYKGNIRSVEPILTKTVLDAISSPNEDIKSNDHKFKIFFELMEQAKKIPDITAKYLNITNKVIRIAI